MPMDLMIFFPPMDVPTDMITEQSSIIHTGIFTVSVSPPLFESIELMSRADVLARIDATVAAVFQ